MNIYDVYCRHPRTRRIDDNFVLCLACGESYVDQTKVQNNKTINDFIRESKHFDRHVTRNRNNNIISHDYPIRQKDTYYMDSMGVNTVVVHNPPDEDSLYQVTINNKKRMMYYADIAKIIQQIKAFRVSKDIYDRRPKKTDR